MSWPGRGRTQHSLYALKLRATIIGYIPPIVVYGTFESLLGETYLLHSRVHISSPWFACILAVDLGVCSLCASWPLGSRLLEYIYALLSLGPFIFGMLGILFIADFTTPGESHWYGLPLSLYRLLRPLGPFFVL